MVLLPEPVAPMMPRVSPLSRVKLTSSRHLARCPPAKEAASASGAVERWVKLTWSNSRNAPLELLRASVRGSTGWSSPVSSTRPMRSAEAEALLRSMKMRLRPMTLLRMMVKYVRNARMTPGSDCPAFTRWAPRMTTSTRPMFRHSCTEGPGMAMMMLAFRSLRVRSSLVCRKRRFS